LPLTPFPRPHTARELSALGTPLFVEENVDDMVIKKAMAACMYCDDVLPAPSNQVRHAYGIITIHFMMMPKRNLA